MKDYGKIHGEKYVTVLQVSIDNRYLFTGGEQGKVKQWSIKRMKLLKDYVNVKRLTPNRHTEIKDSSEDVKLQKYVFFVKGILG